MVLAPALSHDPLGSGSPFGPTGETTSRKRIRGVLVIGFAVETRDPVLEGSAWPLPVGDGFNAGPVGATTWLLITSMGISRIDVSLARRKAGSRVEISNFRSPSIIEENGAPPSA